MTHISNFAHDRLALYLFNALFSFVRRWTQLELIAERPLTLGKKYFEIFPEDKMPVWTVRELLYRDYYGLLCNQEKSVLMCIDPPMQSQCSTKECSSHPICTPDTAHMYPHNTRYVPTHTTHTYPHNTHARTSILTLHGGKF